MRMMTAAKLKTLKRPGRYRCDPSLYLFVKPTGSRSWVQRLVVDGVRREIGLGGYPDVTLTDAREQAAENRRLTRKGGNPLAKVRQVPTFGRAAKLTHDANRARVTKQASAAWLATLTRYAFPLLADRRVDRIEQGDVLRVLSPVWTAKPPTARKRCGPPSARRSPGRRHTATLTTTPRVRPSTARCRRCPPSRNTSARWTTATFPPPWNGSTGPRHRCPCARACASWR